MCFPTQQFSAAISLSRGSSDIDGRTLRALVRAMFRCPGVMRIVDLDGDILRALRAAARAAKVRNHRLTDIHKPGAKPLDECRHVEVDAMPAALAQGVHAVAVRHEVAERADTD